MKIFFNKNNGMATIAFCLSFAICSFGQTTTPCEIVNNSNFFADSEIYIAMLGQTNAQGPVWIDFKANAENAPAIGKIESSVNTLHKPNSTAGYANVFTKLSEIKEKKIHIPSIFGCRMFFSFKSPMYIRFDNNGGYAGADLQNPNDPNAGIRWEIIELTWGDNGFWANTTRVDAYQFAMGLELFGKPGGTNIYSKTGEILPHSEIIKRFKNTFTSGDFQPCYRADIFTDDSLGSIIEQPSKLKEFKDNGASQYYFQKYIDGIWNYFQNNDLIVNLSGGNQYKGRVDGGAFKVTGPGGVQAWISSKPNTQEAIEAKGVLAENVAATPDNGADLAFQAQFCAALNRGVIKLTSEPQRWNDSTQFFKSDTYNKYVWFFHQPDLSYNSKCYAFAFDDVYDQSATLVTLNPEKVRITIGGFAGKVGIKAPLPYRQLPNYDLLTNATKNKRDITLYSVLGKKLAVIKSGVHMRDDLLSKRSALHTGLYIMSMENQDTRLQSKQILVK